jgi:Ser/Thr protein kinase RdoA (MazF antagonist)
VPGRVVAVPPEEVDRWCRAHLGAEVAEELFRCGYLSTVIGVRLTSGEPVVVKIRQPADRLVACAAVHRAVYDRGFPCAEPLVDLQPLGRWVANAEALVEGGEPLPAAGRAAGPFAEALARLLALTPGVDEVPSLDPPLPWTGWSREQRELWPWPDDRDVDLNRVDGPAWVDEAARAARRRLEHAEPAPVLGHGDWHSGNLRWTGNDLHVAFDWDSVVAAPETVLVGLAAAIYPGTAAGTEATVDETEEFLDAYGSARCRPLDAQEREEAWAAGLWTRSFDAKKQLATDGSTQILSEEEARERRRRAGNP